MLREVETLRLVLGRETKSDHLVHDEEQHQRADDGDAPGDRDTRCLIADLAPVTVDAAGGNALAECGIDGLRGENSGEQRTDGSAGAVDTEGIERIVIAEE